MRDVINQSKLAEYVTFHALEVGRAGLWQLLMAAMDDEDEPGALSLGRGAPGAANTNKETLDAVSAQDLMGLLTSVGLLLRLVADRPSEICAAGYAERSATYAVLHQFSKN